MNSIGRTITADKGGIIAHLQDAKDYRDLQAKNEYTTIRNRRYQSGYADGLQFAIHVLEDWDSPDDKREAQLRWARAELACLQRSAVRNMAQEQQTETFISRLERDEWGHVDLEDPS